MKMESRRSFENKLKLLVVDDSPTCLTVVKNLLAEEPYILKLCDSSRLGLTEVITFKPDLVMCDLEMPELHGFEFIKKVRTMPEGATLPILVMTGHLDSDSMANSILAGADAFVAKDQLRQLLKPNLLALLRIKKNYEKAIQGKQLEAVQALIGKYKHEFGNSLTIWDLMIRKLTRTRPELSQDSLWQELGGVMVRMQGTLAKLDELREYSEEPYGSEDKILKVG